jgi:ribosome biogenesis GTPase
LQGRIYKALSGFYYTKTAEKTYMCRARGRFKNQGKSPLVGDMVEIIETPSSISGELEGRIDKIFPRKNEFVRPPVANIDVFGIVIAAAEPTLSLEMLDRFLVMSEANNVRPTIIISKLELAQDPNGLMKKLNSIYSRYYNISYISLRANIDGAIGKENIGKLVGGFVNQTLALAGPSGVGKTSIIKSLLEGNCAGEDNIKSKDTRYFSGDSLKISGYSRKLNKGRSTTRHIELHTLDTGTLLMDTPGFAAFENVRLDETPESVGKYFPEFGNKCKYSNCKHLREPGCDVKERLERGELARSRYDSYIKIQSEQKKLEEIY